MQGHVVQRHFEQERAFDIHGMAADQACHHLMHIGALSMQLNDAMMLLENLPVTWYADPT